jgi:hypothetical protein
LKQLGFDFASTVSDSSISGTGFETVTAPATFSIHKERWPHLFDKGNTSSYLKEVFKGCGIHIHLDRASFTDLHLGKFAEFFHNKKNVKFLQMVGGRTLNGYCPQREGITQESGKGNTTGDFKGTDKYSSLNMGKTHTVEIRIFDSRNDKVFLLSCIEFAHAVFNFTRRLNRFKMTPGDFCKWLLLNKSNRDMYPNLVTRLQGDIKTYSETLSTLISKGIINEPTDPKVVKEKLNEVRKEEEEKRRIEKQKAKERKERLKNIEKVRKEAVAEMVKELGISSTTAQELLTW